MISSLEFASHLHLGDGAPPLSMPVLVSLLTTMSMGAVSLRVLLSLILNPFLLLPYVVTFTLLILVERNLAVSWLTLVIKVFSSLRFNFSSDFIKFLILRRISLVSFRVPLTPTIQSSAYLTYISLLYWGSATIREGIMASFFCILRFSLTSSVFRFSVVSLT